MDSNQIFQLIDTVLPFEACLYYQVLPLSLEGHIFRLGVVDPKDTSALDYVRRILAYMNCSVVTQPVSAEEQRSMLSAYLFHTSQQPVTKEPRPSASVAKNSARPSTDSVQETLTTKIAETQTQSSEATVLQTPIPSEATVLQTPVSSDEAALSESTPILEVNAHHLNSPAEVLASLPPQQLLQELLGRVLEGGIGRLYFERQQLKGKILWSQDGILKSVLEGLDPSVFQGVINELKRMTQLPLIPLQQPRQVEIERVYQETHLLLRLRLMPGAYGEEATLQVLRGAALRFYQQQQLSNLSRDALRLAEQLQRKVNEIRDRTRLTPVPLEVLPALEQLLKSMDKQIEDLIANREAYQAEVEAGKQEE